MNTVYGGHDWRGTPILVTVVDETITDIAPTSRTVPDVTFLPSLHDHHVHLFAAAARARSTDVSACADLASLAIALAGSGPLRAVGYDDTRIGPIDRRMLDEIVGVDRSVRVQHRGGHLWVLNSAACRDLAAAGVCDIPEDGRFFDRDGDLASATAPTSSEAIIAVAQRAARRGVTAVDDLTPTLTNEAVLRLQRDVSSILDLRVFGAAEPFPPSHGVKIVLSDAALPTPDALVASITSARPAPIALHCASVDALAVILAVADHLRRGDRIEHAFVTPEGIPEAIVAAFPASLGFHPGFLRTHGDRHAEHGDPRDQADYLRARSWYAAGAILLGGTDSPFATHDPWAAMAASADRSTSSGRVLNADEALTPEQAATAFTTGGLDSRGARLDLLAGSRADFCLIDGSWAQARRDLASVSVSATMRRGRFTHGNAEHGGGAAPR